MTLRVTKQGPATSLDHEVDNHLFVKETGLPCSTEAHDRRLIKWSTADKVDYRTKSKHIKQLMSPRRQTMAHAPTRTKTEALGAHFQSNCLPELDI